jgi:ubiquinone/menaquinone biosynthesis C-methylase UbiE
MSWTSAHLMSNGIYSDGSYRENNPDWHAVDSRWKARLIASMLARNSIEFDSCVEVGCGAGRILAHLAELLPGKAYTGYDVSPDAAELWRASQQARVSYHLADFRSTSETYDLLLLIDVFEHVEDYMGFLRSLSRRARWYVFHIPLELQVSALLRDRQIHSRKQVGHLHYFSRATALATLADTGYRIVGEEYTHLSQETQEGRRPLTILANLVRAGLQSVSTDLAAKLLGGYSLLVLCQGADAAPIQASGRNP